MDNQKKIPVIELYPCIQGEGMDMGKPMFMIRLSGCRLRCQFSDTSFCDTPYASWNPEKSKFSFSYIEKLFSRNKNIDKVLISGGGPTIHKKFLPELVEFCKSQGKYVCIETEGSEYVETQADLISLSPKLSSSKPRVGTVKPWTITKDSFGGESVTESDLKQHEKWRTNYTAMMLLINHQVYRHKDYQFKPVITCLDDLTEVIELIDFLQIPKDKVWLMPEGQTDEELQKNRKWLMEVCIEEGWNYTDRLHVIVYGNKRGV